MKIDQPFPIPKPADFDTISHFDTVVLRTFAYLYSHFPVPRNIAPHHFIAESHRIDSSDDERWCLEVSISAIQFLKDEGYIKYSQQVGHQFNDVILTSKALVRLKMPSTISDKRTSGQQMIDISNEARGALVSGAVSILLSAVFGR